MYILILEILLSNKKTPILARGRISFINQIMKLFQELLLHYLY
jgi:hypothetical protein